MSVVGVATAHGLRLLRHAPSCLCTALHFLHCTSSTVRSCGWFLQPVPLGTPVHLPQSPSRRLQLSGGSFVAAVDRPFQKVLSVSSEGWCRPELPPACARARCVPLPRCPACPCWCCPRQHTRMRTGKEEINLLFMESRVCHVGNTRQIRKVFFCFLFLFFYLEGRDRQICLPVLSTEVQNLAPGWSRLSQQPGTPLGSARGQQGPTCLGCHPLAPRVCRSRKLDTEAGTLMCRHECPGQQLALPNTRPQIRKVSKILK